MARKQTYEELEQRVKELDKEVEKRKLTEAALKESEARWLSITENSSDHIMVLDLDANILFINHTVPDLTKEEVIGTPVFNYTPLEYHKVKADCFKRVMETGAPDTFNTEYRTKDGEVQFFEVRVGPVLSSGEVVALITNSNNITERKRIEEELQKAHDELEQRVEARTAELRTANEQLKGEIEERKRAEEALRESEEKLRVLFENSYDLISLTDANAKTLWANPAWKKVFGSESKYNDDVFTNIHPDDREKVAKSWQDLISNKATLNNMQYSYKMPNGVYSTFESSAFPVVIGKEKFYYTIAGDINERKQAEEALRESQKMQAIATLAGGIAHEFNNTLVGITGNIDLLRMGLPDNENVSKYTERMNASALHMAHLTDQLLAYVRGGKYQPKNISLTDFVDDTLPLIKQTIAPSIRIETDLPHDIFNVETDLTQMQMVLSSILNNSAEAIEDKGRIRIITRNEEIKKKFAKNHPGLKPGSYVSLTVEDDGKGMDEETRAKIFDPFFTTKFQGRGLGMAAVYGIVTNHGGWISVDSELGKGTVVRIYLPAVELQVKEVERPKIEPAKGTGTILVIEDEDIVIDVICAMLEYLGYCVLLARTGKEALNIAKGFDEDIDLAILDILLPDLAAKEVYRGIMEARPNLKVIVCSGYAIDGPPQKIMDAGAQDFIKKPFSYVTLSEKLKEVLEGK